jgi:hypothetical protein
LDRDRDRIRDNHVNSAVPTKPFFVNLVHDSLVDGRLVTVTMVWRIAPITKHDHIAGRTTTA